MKKLNKHPKLFKKIAQTLKKLIMNKIKQLRTKMINNKPSKLQKVKTCSKTGHFPSQRTGKSLSSPDFNGIINLDNIRSIPYDTFYLRITPFDRDTYLKMIEANLSSRLEITVSPTKPIKYIISVLNEKWKNVQKKHSKCSLYLIPIEEIWIPNELTIFSSTDEKAYDIGDIFTSYGSPSTNVLHMKYQWSDSRKEKLNESNNINNSIINNNDSKINNYLQLKDNDTLINENNNSNCAIKNDDSSEEDISDCDECDNENDNEQEKYFPLESELNVFDPLEFLGIEDERRNSTDDEKYSDINNNNSFPLRTPSIKKNFHFKRSSNDSSRSRSNFNANVNNNNNANNSANNLNANANSNSKLRTGYSEVFSQKKESNTGLMLSNNTNNNVISYNDTNLNQISSHVSSSNLSKNNNTITKPVTKKKIPFVNNVKKEECEELKSITQNATPIKKNTPKKNTIVFNNNNERQLSNFGMTSLFAQESLMNGNNNNTRFIDNFGEMSNFITQNSNFNSIFEHNNNTNMDFFKNNFTSSNIFKTEFNKNNSNMIEQNDNNMNMINEDNEEKEKDDELLSKKTKRKKERKKKEKKITIEEIEESEKNQKIKKNKKPSTTQNKQQSTQNFSTYSTCNNNPYIINQNNYFTNYPGQYYPQLPIHLDIPLPSKFMDDKSNYSYMFPKPN